MVGLNAVDDKLQEALVEVSWHASVWSVEVLARLESGAIPAVEIV